VFFVSKYSSVILYLYLGEIRVLNALKKASHMLFDIDTIF